MRKSLLVMFVIEWHRMSSTVCLEKVVSVMSVLAKISRTQTREQIDSQDIFMPFTWLRQKRIAAIRLIAQGAPSPGLQAYWLILSATLDSGKHHRYGSYVVPAQAPSTQYLRSLVPEPIPAISCNGFWDQRPQVLDTWTLMGLFQPWIDGSSGFSANVAELRDNVRMTPV